MFPAINPVSTNSWKQLTAHKKIAETFSISELCADKERYTHFSIEQSDVLFDFSKNLMTLETKNLLLSLAHECKLKEAIDAMFNGEHINKTEDRAVLHTALRNFSGKPVLDHGIDVMPEIIAVREQMKLFCNKIHSGEWKGYTGKKIRYIVNIGIGGSDLGPVMVTEALKPYQLADIDCFFISNVDAAHLASVLKKIDAAESLFLIASKTFTTQETMMNAHSVRKWFLDSGAEEKDIAQHFVAISTNEKEVVQFGINKQQMFRFWDWVGGRYSVWSAIGLSVALAMGYNQFEKLLQGAFDADQHFNTTPFQNNIPVIMGLIGVWYRNFWDACTETVLPYDQQMHRFAAYLQQGNMESNGKSVDRNNNLVNYGTGPVIWGEPGTNGQHAFYQLLHQGTQLIPCDFIAPAQSHFGEWGHHTVLLSNFFAQTEALMNGTHHQNPHRVFKGNKPSNSFLLEKITPYTLGKLMAFYEHKIFVQGIIWNIYSFDQWGVELGKILANKILPELHDDAEVNTHDVSTNNLINTYKRMRQRR